MINISQIYIPQLETALNRLTISALLTLAALLPSTATAQLTVLLSEESAVFPTNPNANIGFPENIERLVGRPDISTNGRYIGVEAELLAPAAEDDSAVIIDLQTGTQTVLARQGTTMLAGEPVGFVAESVVRVNNAGQAAFHAGNSAAIFWDGTTLTRLVGTGDPSPAGAPLSEYGGIFSQTQLTNDGRVAGQYDSDGTGMIPDPDFDDFLSLGSTVLAAGNETFPGLFAPEGSTATGFIESFTEFYLSAEGTHWISEIRTDEDGAYDSAIVVNGTAMAQQGHTTHITPGGVSVTYDNTLDAAIAETGDWITQSRSDNSIDYTLVNGEVIFAEDEMAPNGDTFSSMSGIGINTRGDYLSLWNTDSGNSLLILNEGTIVLSEGVTMNVDYNGDGIFEDLVVDNFTTGGFSLADDGTLVVTVTFDEPDGTRVGNALTILDISDLVSPVLGDINLDGFVTFADLSPFLALLTNNEFQAEGDINGDGFVTFADLSPFIALLTGS